MMKYLTQWVFCMCACVTLFATAADEEKLTVAVMKFEVRGDLGIKDGGAIISEWMISGLAKTGKFVLLEQVLLQKVVEEQELQSTHLVDEKKMAAEIGRLYGVKAIVSGTVLKWGSTVSIVARMIDTNSGVILKTAEIKTQNVDHIPNKLDQLARLVAGVAVQSTPTPVAPPVVPPVATTFRLTIVTDPENAKVRILNIGPRYYDGIALAPGAYHIEVSRAGFGKRKRWIELQRQNQVVEIELDALEDEVTDQHDAHTGILTGRGIAATLPGIYSVVAYKENGVALTLSAQMELQRRSDHSFDFHTVFQYYDTYGQLVTIHYRGTIGYTRGRWMINVSYTDQPDWVDAGEVEMAMEVQGNLLGMGYVYDGDRIEIAWRKMR